VARHAAEQGANRAAEDNQQPGIGDRIVNNVAPGFVRSNPTTERQWESYGDDGQRALKPGDVVIQIGSWHAWSNPNQGSQMAFVMMGASFED